MKKIASMLLALALLVPPVKSVYVGVCRKNKIKNLSIGILKAKTNNVTI
ncbi:MAG: hypothetical protein LBS61_01650 [Endomicrobium sp.]|nr:hypothetical protein [Endomicrobium sp.]